jgi:hypothetical protein
MVESFEERLAIIRGRILGLLFTAKHSMGLDEIVEAYLENWKEDERLIIREVGELVRRGYVDFKVVYGERVFWLSSKGRKFVLGVLRGS